MGLGPAPFCGRKTKRTLHHSSLCIRIGALTSPLDISGGVPPLVLRLESRTVSRSCSGAEAVTCSFDGYDFSDCRLVYLLVEKRGLGGRPQIHLLSLCGKRGVDCIVMDAVRAQSQGKSLVQYESVVSFDVIRMALFICVPHLYRSALSQLEAHNVVQNCLGVRSGNGLPIGGSPNSRLTLPAQPVRRIFLVPVTRVLRSYILTCANRSREFKGGVRKRH